MVSINDMVGVICNIEQVSMTLKHIPGPECVRGRNFYNTLIKEVLNWSPSATLSQGLRSTYKLIKSEIEKEKTSGTDISAYAFSKFLPQSTETLESIGQVKHSNKTLV